MVQQDFQFCWWWLQTNHLDQVSGTFIEGEQVRINGDDSLTRSITTVQKFGLEDVKSVHQEDTFISGIDFSGDLVLQPKLIKGIRTWR